MAYSAAMNEDGIREKDENGSTRAKDFIQSYRALSWL